MRRDLYVYVLLAFLAACGDKPGDNNDDEAIAAACAALSSDLQSELEETVDAPGGAAMVVMPTCTWSGATGEAIRSSHEPMTAGAQFFGASLTKTFTAIVILQLAGEGSLSLDDQVTEYVPDFTDAAGLTVRQLLNHTTGLYDFQMDAAFYADYSADLDREWQPEELLAYASGKAATNAPGLFHYCGTNTILAGLVIEAVTGTTVTAEFRSRIIGPLHLDATYHAGFEEAAPGELAHGYSGYPGVLDRTAQLQRQGHVTASWTTGSMVTTVPDVTALFDALLVKETLLAPAELAEMKVFVETDDLFKEQLKVPGYGLGLIQRTSVLGFGFGNGGSSPGWLSRAFYFPDHAASIVVMTNNGSINPEPLMDGLAEVISER